MAFRNFVNKSSGKEASFMIKNPPVTPRDVGSPTRSEQGEASSKALVKTEKAAEINQEVVDVEQYKIQGEGQVSIAKRVSSRKGASSGLGKRRAPPPKGPTAKKGKPISGGKGAKDKAEASEDSGDNLPSETNYGIFAGTPEPSHCHRVIAACAPKGWMRGLDRMPVEELADLHSQSSLQLAIIDNVLNTKTREASRDLLRSQEEVESLNTKLLASEEEIKVVKAKCMDLEGNIETSEPMVKMKEEVQRLRETLHEQGVEMARLRVEEAKAVEKSSLLPPLQAKCQSLEGEVEKLKMHVTELERMKGEMITKVIPHVCKSLMDSEEAGVLLANCINSARVWERAIVLEELAASGQKVVLSKREDYNAEAAYLYDSAGEALANAQFPYVQEVSANPDASVEDLLSISPKKVSTL